ncbi:MAG: hypothetical protein ACJ8FY_18725 [Gemmataceae bacterium]
MTRPRTRQWPLVLPCRGANRVVRLQEEAAAPAGRAPRLARLMALAIRFHGLLRKGTVADQAELARLGHVSRARISQILNLLHLAPDIQEQLLFLAPHRQGRERLHLVDVQPLCRCWDWCRQRWLWQALQERLALHDPQPEKP